MAEKIYLYDYAGDPAYKYDKYTSPLIPYRYADTPEGVIYWDDNPDYGKHRSKSVYDAPGMLNLFNLGATGTANNNSAETVEGAGLDYSFFNTLLSTVGGENEQNRQFNSAEAVANRQFQSEEAEKNRQWQEAMSNSAYTRAVADMKNAGLNPALLFGNANSASTPVGSTAQGSAASYNVGGGDTLSSFINSLANSVEAVGSLLQYFLPSLKKLVK